jgi:hypothetical protein
MPTFSQRKIPELGVKKMMQKMQKNLYSKFHGEENTKKHGFL